MTEQRTTTLERQLARLQRASRTAVISDIQPFENGGYIALANGCEGWGDTPEDAIESAVRNSVKRAKSVATKGVSPHGKG